MDVYTFRVRRIEDFHRRVRASAATEVTDVLVNDVVCGRDWFHFLIRQ